MRLLNASPVEAVVPRIVETPWQGKLTSPLVRGDYLVVTCSDNIGAADVVMEWGEEI